MIRPALISVALLGVFGCGNLDRDVISQREQTDMSAVADAGAVPSEPADASPHVVPHETTASCTHGDGGCPPPSHCDPNECSLSCPLGCTGSIQGSSPVDHTKSHKRPPPPPPPHEGSP